MSVNGNDAFGITLGGDASSGYEATTGTSIPIVLATEEDASRTVVRFGDANQFIKFDSGGTPKLFISSSNYFLGGSSQFISGSNGNIEISSSNFHLTREGNITASNANLSGKVTATSGEIGGFSIGEGAISGDSFFISGSATSNELFISSSGFTVSAVGSIIANNGLISNFKLNADRILFGEDRDWETRIT